MTEIMKCDIVPSKYEPKTYVGNKVVKCADCNKTLGTFIITDKQISSKYMIKCPCGGSSYLQTFESMAIFAPHESLTLTNVDTDSDTTILETEKVNVRN